jgi:hypothetical protein
MLYLRHNFYNIIFKIEHKLYIASGSAPTPVKNSGHAPGSFQRLRALKCTNRPNRVSLRITHEPAFFMLLYDVIPSDDENNSLYQSA